MTNQRIALGATLALLATLTLAGCSVGFTGSTGEGKSGQTDSSDGASSADGVSAAEGADGADGADGASDAATSDVPAAEELPDPSVSTGDAEVTALLRDASENLGFAATTMSCPGGSLTIDGVGVVVRISEPCENLTVSGAGSLIMAGDVTNLTVSGVGTMVAVASAGTVTFSGAPTGAVVGWETGTPTVTGAGTGILAGQIADEG